MKPENLLKESKQGAEGEKSFSTIKILPDDPKETVIHQYDKDYMGIPAIW